MNARTSANTRLLLATGLCLTATALFYATVILVSWQLLEYNIGRPLSELESGITSGLIVSGLTVLMFVMTLVLCPRRGNWSLGAALEPPTKPVPMTVTADRIQECYRSMIRGRVKWNGRVWVLDDPRRLYSGTVRLHQYGRRPFVTIEGTRSPIALVPLG